MDYFKIAQAVFMLIFFLFAVYAIAYLILRLFCKAIVSLGKWLLGYKTVANFIDYARQKMRMWYEKYKPRFISLWDFLSEMVITPLFWSYSLYALVTRIQSISDYSKAHPEYSFWRLLDLDMNADTSFYFIFIAFFLAWMAWRAWRHNQKVRYEKTVLKKLENIENTLKTSPYNIRRISIRNEAITRGKIRGRRKR